MYHFFSGASACWTDTNFTTEPDKKGKYAFLIAVPGTGPFTDVDPTWTRDRPINLGVAPMFVKRGQYPKTSVIHNQTRGLEINYKFSNGPPIPTMSGEMFPEVSTTGSAVGYAVDTNIRNYFWWRPVQHPSGRWAVCLDRRDDWSFRATAMLTIHRGEPFMISDHNWDAVWPDKDTLLDKLMTGGGVRPWGTMSEIAYYTPTPKEISDYDRKVSKYLSDAQLQIWSELDPGLSDYFDHCLESITGPNMSWLETLIPLKSLPKDIIKLVGKVPRNLGDLADIFLSLKYGILPIPRDIENILSAIRHVFRLCLGDYDHLLKGKWRKTIVRGPWTCDISTSTLVTIENKVGMGLAMAGVDDIATEIWNCIPFSFVVDWVLGIGDTINRIENRSRWKRLQIHELCYSYKCTCEGSKLQCFFPDGTEISGSYSVYLRRYLTGLPSVNYFQLPDLAENFRRHWVEGAALIVQQRS